MGTYTHIVVYHKMHGKAPPWYLTDDGELNSDAKEHILKLLSVDAIDYESAMNLSTLQSSVVVEDMMIERSIQRSDLFSRYNNITKGATKAISLNLSNPIIRNEIVIRGKGHLLNNQQTHE